MSKRKTSDKGAPHTAKTSDAGSNAAVQSHLPSAAAIRETIESVVVAFVLAFLFRTFEAEAFVIPTGSMAPTLMGRHKDLDCEKCGYPFRVSASEEVDQDTGELSNDFIQECICPMCRYTTELGAGAAARSNYPSYKGDRILVAKFAYEFSEPKRWDVAVFKFPGGAKTNYIKRLVGKPRELLRITRGDIFTGPLPEDEDWNALEILPPTQRLRVLQDWTTIERKPADKTMAMLQPVFDNDYTPKIIEQGWKQPRWGPWSSPGGDDAAWQPSEDNRSFQSDGSDDELSWVRYQHLVPSREQWEAMLGGRLAEGLPRPQLISDFSGYNTGSTTRGAPEADRVGLHWVGDLALKCTLEVQSDSGQVIFELVEGGRRFQACIDLANGEATLAIDGKALPAAAVQTAVRGPGEHEITFANCDDQMRLWIDGSLVATGDYNGLDLNNRLPTAADLAPVGVGSRGAALKISHLKILRDIYYIAVKYPNLSLDDFRHREWGHLGDPAQWGDCFRDENMRSVAFRLFDDQFLALGDNSSKSKDSRLWGREYFVHRDLLIGKALYIYWPDTKYKIPLFSLPYFPNFSEMGLVR